MRTKCTRPAWLTLLVACVLTAGCQNTAKILETVTTVPIPTSQRQDSCPVGSGQGPNLAAGVPSPRVASLFAKGTVNGAELVEELVWMRTQVLAQRRAGALGSLLGAAAETQQGCEVNGVMVKTLELAQESIKPYLSSIGFGALENHMKLLEDPKMMAAEQVKLPSARGLTAAQMRRVVNMAAIVAATRVTAKVLKKAQEDFANVESDYQKLIERREAAATVLYGLLTDRAAMQKAASLFNAQDLKYLEDNVRRMSVKQFSNDLGAQNLALRVLQQNDPQAWSQYKAKSDEVRTRTRAYIRSTAGVSAFAALLANFGNETIGAVLKNRAQEITGAFPLAWEFTQEVPGLLVSSWKVAASGIVELPMSSTKRFRIDYGQQQVDVSSVEQVVEAMKKQGATAEFERALFRTGFDGLIYKVYRCDPSEAGRMLDAAVPVQGRERFAAEVAPDDAQRFSFQNAFLVAPQSLRLPNLGDELLRKDLRSDASGAFGRPMGDLQRAATTGYARWDSDQLIRLILANREGTAAHASLQVGEFTVRPIPSMQSVFAYELLADQCATQFGGGQVVRPAERSDPPKRTAPPKPAATKPSTPAKPVLPATK